MSIQDRQGNYQKYNSDGSTPTTIVGSLAKEVKEINVFNALAIADIINHETIVDVSTLGRKTLHVVNSLNQSVAITLYVLRKDGYGYSALTTKTLSSGNISYNASDYPYLGEPVQKFAMRVVCTTAPTTGSITINIEGWLN